MTAEDTTAIVIWPQADAAAAIAGWHIHSVPVDSDVGMAARAIAAAASAALSNAPGAGKTAIIFVAEGATAVATCRAILLLDDQKIRVPTGLVSLNAMADMAGDATLDAIAARPDLASLWAVDEHLRDIRGQTLAYHRRLQASARNTHFLVVPAGAGFARELSCARSALGREARWLLNPVNSLS